MLNRLAGRLGGILGALAATLALAGPVQAAKAPILVVDVDSGKVLYSQAPTDPWYPASVTKLMTAYVALSLVRQGRVSMDSLLTVSAQAASEPPSKMGFKPGTQITLDNALKIIMVKSANDVAYAIGENLGGSIDGFAAMMNDAAQRIGMRESHWANPHGLPEPRQWTSARDMAVLGRALIRDFPEARDLFSISAIQYGKAVMANHNGLLGRYTGADGMKTGFICAGGFNVVASATRGGRRIITVVMGQSSARERDLKAADLFDYGFSKSAGWTEPTLDALPASTAGGPPDIRPFVCGGKKSAPVDEGQNAISAGAAPGADNTTAQLLGFSSAPQSDVAFAALNSASLRGRSLPPRAPLQPIPVWIGRNPAEGAEMLAQQEAAAQNEKSAKVEAARQRKEAAKEAARQAKADKAAQTRAATITAPTTKVIADKPKAVPAAASAFAPVARSEAKAAAKPVPAPAAKPVAAKNAAAPAAKSPPTAKSSPAAKSAAAPAQKPAAPTPAAAKRKTVAKTSEAAAR